jgi:hypothetical protein
MNNFLEQLAAEWYEYQGYFVRRNVRVGQLAGGGFAGELDVVAFNPIEKRLVHIEASSDAESWGNREAKFAKKFMTGKARIHEVFPGFELPELEQRAVFGYVYGKNHPPKLGGGTVLAIDEFLEEIKAGIPKSTEHVIHEQFVILRTLQFAKECWASPSTQTAVVHPHT